MPRDIPVRDMTSRGSSDMSSQGMPGRSLSGGSPSLDSALPGNLGGLLKGALGSLLTGGAASGAMGGGLNDLINQMAKRGFAETASSWIGSGPNKMIAPGDLAKVLGADQIDAMTQQSGMSRDELLHGLSRHLPEVVDRLTPDGQIPRHIR